MVYHHPVVSRSRVGILEEGGGGGGEGEEGEVTNIDPIK